MTREELKIHCEKQIENCEMWARCKGEEPHGKVYEEHKLILELLEQEPFINKPCVSSGVCEHDKNAVLNKISAEIEEVQTYDGIYIDRAYVLEIIDKYKAESEEYK